MLNIVWGLSLWGIVFLLIPFERVKYLWKVGLISFFWLFLIDFVYTQLGYYEFSPALSIVGIPLFYLFGGAAGGILLLNWLPRDPLYKALSILVFCSFISLSEQLYIYLGYFRYLENFTALTSYTLNIAGLSLLVWFSLAIIGEEEIYYGLKSRFNKYLKNN